MLNRKRQTNTDILIKTVSPTDGQERHFLMMYFLIVLQRTTQNRSLIYTYNFILTMPSVVNNNGKEHFYSPNCKC